jgi:hypothetical protein
MTVPISTRSNNLRSMRGVYLTVCAFALLGCASSGAGFQKDGTYIPEQREKALDCQGLYKSIWGHAQLLKTLPEKARAEREKAAPSAWLAWGRFFGTSNQGLVAVEEYDRERARIYALHRVMIEKNCVPLDLERELAATEMAMSEVRKQ